MTDSNYTHIALVVDRSGSMQAIAADMNGGIGTFLEGQGKIPGHLLVDAWTFDHTVEHVAKNSPWSASGLRDLVRPRGSTALLDAIGVAVTSLGETLAGLSEAQRPGKVIVVIVTDGFENSSREWTRKAVKDLITKQTSEWAWEFVYLAANDPDTFGTADGLGIGRDRTLSFATTGHGIGSAYMAVNAYATATRSTGGTGVRFTESDREEAAK